MAKTMTASPMTDGQIDDVTSKFRDALRKCRNRVSSDVAQRVAGTDNLGIVCVTPYLELCERHGTMVVRHVTIDYTRSLPQMIEAGRYDSVNSDINDGNFSVNGKGKVEVDLVLVHFDREITSEEVLGELNKMGLRPGILPELLALGEIHPEDQRKYPIIALGSVWQHPYGSRFVPYLSEWNSKRYLNLHWFVSRWRAHCRFVAVRA